MMKNRHINLKESTSIITSLNKFDRTYNLELALLSFSEFATLSKTKFKETILVIAGYYDETNEDQK